MSIRICDDVNDADGNDVSHSETCEPGMRMSGDDPDDVMTISSLSLGPVTTVVRHELSSVWSEDLIRRSD